MVQKYNLILVEYFLQEHAKYHLFLVLIGLILLLVNTYYYTRLWECIKIWYYI